jgi:glycosyltransferase involved in cell wall biosynthesis
VYCEAFAAGVPSVITLSGVAPEFAKHGENCWVVPFRDSQAIFAGLQTLLGAPELMAKIRRRAPEAVLNRFQIESHLRSLEKLYAGETTSDQKT